MISPYTTFDNSSAHFPRDPPPGVGLEPRRIGNDARLAAPEGGIGKGVIEGEGNRYHR